MKNYKDSEEFGGFKKQTKGSKRWDDGVSKKSNYNPKKKSKH